MGHPVRGATVTLKCLDKEATRCASADSDGVFFFWDLTIRTKYSVSIEADGFSHSTREFYLDKEYTDLGRILISEL